RARQGQAQRRPQDEGEGTSLNKIDDNLNAKLPPRHAGGRGRPKMETAPSWGIEPVPERLWVLGVLDGFLLWANLSVSLLVIVAGAFLVLPGSEGGLALSLPLALGAIGAAAVVGNLMLGLG